jgi:hypothetical protein
MKFKQNSDFSFNKVSLKMKIKKRTKKPMVDFIENYYLVQIAKGNIFLQIKGMYSTLSIFERLP